MISAILSLLMTVITADMTVPVVKLLDKTAIDRIEHLKDICDALGIKTSSKTKKADMKEEIANCLRDKPDMESKIREIINEKYEEEKRKKSNSTSVSPSTPSASPPQPPPTPPSSQLSSQILLLEPSQDYNPTITESLEGMDIDGDETGVKRKMTTFDDGDNKVTEKCPRYEYANEDIRNLVNCWNESKRERQEMAKHMKFLENTINEERQSRIAAVAALENERKEREKEKKELRDFVHHEISQGIEKLSLDLSWKFAQMKNALNHPPPKSSKPVTSEKSIITDPLEPCLSHLTHVPSEAIDPNNVDVSNHGINSDNNMVNNDIIEINHDELNNDLRQNQPEHPNQHPNRHQGQHQNQHQDQQENQHRHQNQQYQHQNQHLQEQHPQHAKVLLVSDSNAKYLNLEQLKPGSIVTKAKRYTIQEAARNIPPVSTPNSVVDIVFQLGLNDVRRGTPAENIKSEFFDLLLLY